MTKYLLQIEETNLFFMLQNNFKLYLNSQKTYAHVPAAGESHLNLVNTLDCQLVSSLQNTFYRLAVNF